MRNSLLVLPLLASLAAGACEVSAPSDVPVQRGTMAVHGKTRGGDFVLFNQDGQPWSLVSQRGSVVLMYFGYTTCADACPLMMSRVAGAYRQLGSDASRVSTVFVSVDRERDTPEVLKEYVSGFSVPVTALTGSKLMIDRVTAQYRARYAIDHGDNKTPKSAAGYQVNHARSLFVIDQKGQLREQFPDGVTPTQIASGVKQLLAER